MPDPKATTKGLGEIHSIKPQDIQSQRSIAMENVPMLASFLTLSSCLSSLSQCRAQPLKRCPQCSEWVFL